MNLIVCFLTSYIMPQIEISIIILRFRWMKQKHMKLETVFVSQNKVTVSFVHMQLASAILMATCKIYQLKAYFHQRTYLFLSLLFIYYLRCKETERTPKKSPMFRTGNQVFNSGLPCEWQEPNTHLSNHLCFSISTSAGRWFRVQSQVCNTETPT